MKRIFFIAIFSMMFSMFVIAQPQNATTYGLFSSNVEKTIVRILDYPVSISYIATSSEYYFTYNDGVSNNTINVEFDNTYNVNDFVIEQDTVFFCGSSSNGIGFIGHFVISDFFWGTHSYFITSVPFQDNQNIVGSFDKMVALFHSGCRKIALIGRMTQSYYAVVEVKYSLNSNTFSYRIGVLNPSYNETLQGIALTDNYIVTSGYAPTPTMHGLCFRAYDQSDMFIIGGPQDTVSVFSIDSSLTASGFDESQHVVSHLMTDNIVTATYYKDVNTLNNEGTYVGVYNINSNHDISNWVSIEIAQNYINGGWRLRGITGFDATWRFFLLQYADVSLGNQKGSKLYEFSYSILVNPTFIGVGVKSLINLQSIDARSSRSGYVANGTWDIYPDRFLFNQGSTIPQLCFTPEPTTLSMISMDKNIQYHPLTITTWGVQPLQFFNSNNITVTVQTVYCSE